MICNAVLCEQKRRMLLVVVEFFTDKVAWGKFGTVNVLYGPTDTKRFDISFPFR